MIVCDKCRTGFQAYTGQNTCTMTARYVVLGLK